MRRTFIRFLRQDSGAVIADYVVICAMVAALGVGIMAYVGQGAQSLAQAIAVSQTSH